MEERILSEEAFNTEEYSEGVETFDNWRIYPNGNKSTKTLKKEEKMGSTSNEKMGQWLKTCNDQKRKNKIDLKQNELKEP